MSPSNNNFVITTITFIPGIFSAASKEHCGAPAPLFYTLNLLWQIEIEQSVDVISTLLPSLFDLPKLPQHCAFA
jgi:hypothetical protein